MNNGASRRAGRWSDVTHAWVLLAILGLATALRLPYLARTSLWYDEAVTWSQSRGSLGHLVTSVAEDNYPPLHNLVLWLTMPVIGESESALRLPSVIAGVIAVWLLYLLGKEIFDRQTGLLAAFLLCTSPFHIWFSTEARMYAVFATMGIGFLLCLTRSLKTGSNAALVGTALFGTLFLYSHIYAVFAFAPVGATLFYLTITARAQGVDQHELFLNRLRGLGAMAAAGLLFLPWLFILFGRANDVVTNGFWIAYPDWTFLKVMARDMAGSEFLFTGFAAVIIAGTLVRHKRVSSSASARHKVTGSIPLLAAYVFGPPLIAYGLSVTLRPILFDRYLIAAWPGLLLLTAAAARSLFPKIGPLAVVVATLVLTAAPLQFTLTQKIRPEWRDIAEIYQREHPRSREVSLYKGFAEPALRYYLGDNADITALEHASDIVLPENDHEFWLLLAHSSPQDMKAMENAIPVGYQKTDEWRSFGWGASGLTLRRYSPNAD